MNPAFTVLRIDHVVLRVRDLQNSVRFYTTLGCAVERRRPELGLIHLRAGSSMIDLVSLEGRLGARGGSAPQAEGRNVDHLCLRIEPFDEQAISDHLARSGIEPMGHAAVNFGADGDGPALYIRDPDGNLVELKGPGPASG